MRQAASFPQFVVGVFATLVILILLVVYALKGFLTTSDILFLVFLGNPSFVFSLQFYVEMEFGTHMHILRLWNLLLINYTNLYCDLCSWWVFVYDSGNWIIVMSERERARGREQPIIIRWGTTILCCGHPYWITTHPIVTVDLIVDVKPLIPLVIKH